jgi:hypothetical protein
MALAAALELRPTVTTYSFDDADHALNDLAEGAFTGAAAIRID